MDTNKMRASFEAMILANGKSVRRSGDSYHFGTIHRKWLFWQEAWCQSREAVVVDLSDLSRCFSPNDCGDWAMWLDDVKKLIEVQGLKVAS